MEFLSNQPQAVLGQILVDHVKREAERTAEQTIKEAGEEEFDTRSAQIQDYVSNQLAARNDIGAEAQRELAAAIRLIGDIATTDKPWIRKNLQLLGSIDTTVKALLRESPQIEFAKRTRKHVYRRVHPVFGTGVLQSLKRSVKASPLAVVIVGLFITFVLLTFVPLLSRSLDLSSFTIGTFLKIDPSVLLLIGTIGALGSIASIMVRIRDDFAAYTASSDPWPWFFFGLFKPVIGAVFALFIFALIKSGLLPLEVTDDTEAWLVLVVAFIAGFSERFATDILSSTEQRLGGGQLQSSALPASIDTAAEVTSNGRKREVTETNGAETAQKDE